MTFRSGLLLVLMAGCASPGEIKEKDFALMSADLYCQRLKECDRGNYMANYYGMADCRSFFEAELENLVDVADDLDCDYDDKGAARAWEDLAEMDCESFYEEDYSNSLDKVWDDCALSFFF